ncbi:MAG: hypothetical protein IJU98_11900 [Synergistaceae bacterium]|nr:hypothetical protein [Synergistaceae bacterium]
MFERELTVLPSEASCRGQMKLRSFLNVLQDTAALAVTDLEGTSSELMARGYAWILTRYEVELMGPLPLLDERFVVGTYHDPSHGYGTLRVFQVSRPDGTPLAWAKTSWLLLDLAAGRPVRPAGHIPEILERDTAPIEPDFRDIPGAGNLSSSLEPGLMEFPCPIRFHDLDINGHVNNAVYFEWVYEATPLDLMAWDVRSISASFRSSVRWGEDLYIRVREMEPAPSGARTFLYYAVRGSAASGDGRGEKPATAFMCSWEPRP